MARNDKAPFKREYTLTSIGQIGEEDIYVGDIKTLYISMSPTSTANGIIEGRIGRNGKRFNVPFSLTSGKSGPIDISEVEYINFTATEVGAPTTLNMFGYEDADFPSTIVVDYEENILGRDVENTAILKDIRDELRTLNTYMYLITGENLSE